MVSGVDVGLRRAGLAPGDVMVLAAAVELLHCATLVHDDVIDDAAARRGVATVNAVEGSSTAILAGDVLIAAACGLATRTPGARRTGSGDRSVPMCGVRWVWLRR